jgi:exodeoxyribonuclease VII large subunit
MSNNRNIYRVSEVNRYVKSLLQGDPMLRDLWVAGELSNFKHHRSGHMYFTVKDGGASLRCVYFRRENAHCIFKPADGMEVLLHGNISVYEPDGAYQLYVSEMEPAGMGSLYLAYEQLKNRLETEGLFRQDLKKPIPALPQKIGLITSPTGAALQDMLATIKIRFPHVELLVVESLVQGAGAAADLVEALNLLNRRDDIDVIILARGGGSLEDLWPFNEEAVARAIYSSEIPVISAIGHETDFTIADFVADFRAATPTAAAQAVVPDLAELNQGIVYLRERAFKAQQRRLQKEKQLLDHIVSERFFRGPALRVKANAEVLERLKGELNREIVRALKMKGLQLSALLDRLEGISPLQVMNRGYSFCRDEDGAIVRSVKEVKIGKMLHLSFKDGRALCRAEKIEEEQVVER